MSSSAAAPPSWWWLGDELWKNVHDEPATKAALDVMLNPPKRKRAEEQDAAAAASSTAPSEPAAAAKAEPPPRLVDKRVELQLDELDVLLGACCLQLYSRRSRPRTKRWM